MSDDEQTGDKPYEPTQKKLDDARRKGELASSADLTAAAAYSGVVLAAVAAGPAVLSASAAMLAGLLERSDALSRDIFAGGGRPFAGTLLAGVAAHSAVWFAVPAILALAAVVAQRALVFAPEKVEPRLSRISLLSNARQKFGRGGLFEFAKSFTKLALYSVVLGAFLWRELPVILSTVAMQPGVIVTLLLGLSLRFFVIVLLIAALVGVVDYFWQRAEHLRKHRMSHKELTDESKESEGDPYLKQARRQKGYDIATNRMLGDVPLADVVVVNPTHYAVALTWNRAGGGAPVCVAKGVDGVAGRIRALASEHGVPIRRDPQTARALFAAVEIGQEILPEHYRPVAAAIRFAEAMRRRAGSPRRPG